MQDDILLSIFFDLLQTRKTTASALAEKYNVSTRTIYRYVDKLSSFAPIHILRGRKGGVCLSDSYRLPVDFLNAEEHEAVVTALHNAYANEPKECYLSAKRKITATVKTERFRITRLVSEDIFIVPTKEENGVSEKLRCVQTALREKKILRLLAERKGEREDYAVEPHALVLVGNEWYLCAFCYAWRSFSLFSLPRLIGVLRTNERFRPRKFNINELLTGIPGIR